MQCRGDCDTPQVCASCALSCCWWESSGIADLSTGVWVGQLCQVNFIGDTIATQEFVCIDLSAAELVVLWQHLPDDIDEIPSQQVVALDSPRQVVQALVLCPDTAADDSVLGISPAPMVLTAGAGYLAVYSDGSLQGAGSGACCGGAGVAVLDGDRLLWELGVHIGGWLSSMKTEVYACIMALRMLPQH